MWVTDPNTNAEVRGREWSLVAVALVLDDHPGSENELSGRYEWAGPVSVSNTPDASLATNCEFARLEEKTVRGSIETGYDGTRWFNRVIGSPIAASYRDTQIEAETTGRAMAQARGVAHIVTDQSGTVISHIRY